MSKRGQPRLYKRLTLATLTAVIGLGGAAQAEIYGGGPVYGGPTSVGGSVVCRAFNFGATPITIPTRDIFNPAGAAAAKTFDNCNVDLPLGGSCAFAATIATNGAYSCRLVVVGPSSDEVSGAVEAQAPGGAIISVLPLQK